jgi:hypothetical protein
MGEREGHRAVEDGEENDAQGPDVRTLSIVGMTGEELGCGIAEGAAESVQIERTFLFVEEVPSETEVCEFDVKVPRHEDVLAFDPSVDDPHVVEVHQG